MKIIDWLKQSHRLLRKIYTVSQHKLKLVAIEHNNTFIEPILLIQKGKIKNNIEQKLLSELLNDENSLLLFCKRDIEKIIELKTRRELMPKMHLCAHFSQNSYTQIVLEDRNNNIRVEKICSIARNWEIINQLSPKDAYIIGYLLGCEEMD